MNYGSRNNLRKVKRTVKILKKFFPVNQEPIDFIEFTHKGKKYFSRL